MIRSYSEMMQLETFEERYEYLRLGGIVGDPTFGFDRYLNQALYQSFAWKSARRHAVIRDGGCDLAHPDYTIHGSLLVHHISPITVEDITQRRSIVLDLNNLVTTTNATHNAIHFGDSSLLRKPPVERSAGDTKLW